MNSLDKTKKTRGSQPCSAEKEAFQNKDKYHKKTGRRKIKRTKDWYVGGRQRAEREAQVRV